LIQSQKKNQSLELLFKVGDLVVAVVHPMLLTEEIYLPFMQRRVTMKVILKLATHTTVLGLCLRDALNLRMPSLSFMVRAWEGVIVYLRL
jgi:hypothetical protein